MYISDPVASPDWGGRFVVFVGETRFYFGSLASARDFVRKLKQLLQRRTKRPQLATAFDAHSARLARLMARPVERPQVLLEWMALLLVLLQVDIDVQRNHGLILALLTMPSGADIEDSLDAILDDVRELAKAADVGSDTAIEWAREGLAGEGWIPVDRER